MRPRSFLRSLARALFILYCVEVGVFLTMAPWRSGWSTLLIQFPLEALRGPLLTPWGRGAVTGFGLVHLVWGLHDLREILDRRRVRLSGSDERVR
ncbi:MAG TPA: hypothetical protein VMV46_23635 [Thermoanaerobaculia bacterium]|nr:hypothetical protein [Thermoanaerobaculia bacterium]